MKFFDAFSGIGGFHLGIQGANPDTECVGFSEIDKYAISVYERQFPNITNFGDIGKIDTKELPDFDILVGGFPCQSFSIAGKRVGFEDTRGTLFFELARILADKRPGYFCFENVKGLLSSRTAVPLSRILELLYKEVMENICQIEYKPAWETVADNLSVYLQKTGKISGLLQNLKFLLDQNLPIIKKSNCYTEEMMARSGLSVEEWVSSLPLLCSIVNLSRPWDMWWLDDTMGIVIEIVLLCQKLLEENSPIKKSSITSMESKMMIDLRTCISALQEVGILLFILKQSISLGSLWKRISSSLRKVDTYYVKTFNIIVNTITELGYDCQWQLLNSRYHGVPQNRERIFVIGHLRGKPRPEVFPFRYNDEQGKKSEETATTNTLTIPARVPVIIVKNHFNFQKKDIFTTIDASYYKGFDNHQQRSGIYNGISIRRLTPVECERLQGFPDNFTKFGKDGEIIFDSQRYKQCGNAVSVPVVEALFTRFFDSLRKV